MYVVCYSINKYYVFVKITLLVGTWYQVHLVPGKLYGTRLNNSLMKYCVCMYVCSVLQY